MTGVNADPEAFELMVLRLVSAGGVNIGQGGYLHQGSLIAGDMAAALIRLLLGGCLVVGQPGPDKRRVVSVTVAGETRRAVLERGGDLRG
ncbi:MAG: hypothetical protein LC799_16080 [Actinobacteria bacterium]|nr:hypothetical protein [Actinomycetota bacterium]